MEDARRIAPLLRNHDRIEIEAASGTTPEAALAFSMLAPGDTVFAETREGDPIMIAGVCRSHPHAATIWMVGTPLLERYALQSVRVGLRLIERWHETFPVLWNMAWEDNDLHVRWLKLLGFTFLRRLDVRGNTFIEFARIKTCADPKP